MVSKLIKHEIRRTLRWFVIIVLGGAIVVGFAALGAVLLPMPLSSFFALLAVIGAVAVPSVVPVWLGVDFYRSSYSKTGYLTRALPVKGSTIYWVKLLYAYVLSLLAVLVGALLGYVGGIAMTVAGGGTAGDVNAAIAGAWELIVTHVPTWIIVVALLLLVLWPFVWLASYYFAAAVGSEAWANKLGVGGPILVWFLFYAASQAVALLGALLPLQLVFADGMVRFKMAMTNFMTMEQEQSMPLGIFFAMFLLAVVGICWASVSFDKKVELR